MSLKNVIHMSNVRLSFPHIAAPQVQKDNKGNEKLTYSAAFLMPPDHPDFAKVMSVIQELAAEKWKQQGQAVIQMCNTDPKKRFYGQGHEKINQKTMKVYDGYEGMVYISCSNRNQPQIIDAATGQAIDPLNTMATQNAARQMFAGCYVNAAIKPWLQENEHGRGIRCELVAVQFRADGQPFGEGPVDASGMFAPVEGAPAPAWGAQTPPAMPAAPFAAPAPAAAPWCAPAAAPWGAPAAPPWA